jgi:hypothetical protein
MNKECAYEYGSISEGSYFGDISVLLREPNSFSYVSNDYENTPLQLLRIESHKFMNICDNFPCSKEVLIAQAKDRNETFHNYKTIRL